MTEALEEYYTPVRLASVVLGYSGLLALILSGIGVYGMLAFAVDQRTREIGIRIALGAGRGHVFKLAMGQGMVLTLIGVAVGLAGSFGLTRFLSSLLYGVYPNDSVTLIVASMSLGFVALLASYIPARRATKVDPMVALRYE